MGIPAFYRWLVTKYPLSVVEVLEEVPGVVNGEKIPLDTSKRNPNGVEFDNLYLDMNGIIHPCFHPEGRPAPDTYDEVFKDVFRYIDRIFSLVRPRKILYMAIDGVAPRAKMNQQRARRFRSSKDAADAAAEEKLKHEYEKMLPTLEQAKTLDSNVITPGTEFMASLTSALQYYIHLRLNSDPGWRGIKVILSDASVPGEGEHKIMSYIRLQRNLPGYDPNTRHCLYGLDADLIMLGLATHEIHFAVLREDVRMDQNKSKRGAEAKSKLEGKDANDNISNQCFVFLNVWVLRDYLVHDMKIPGSAVKQDIERLIDDFVFMCVFVGNDFLPHVPSLDISEGALDLLMDVYKKEFVNMGGHLTNSYEVNLKRVEHFLQMAGLNENAIFRKRSQVEKEKRQFFKDIPGVNRGGFKGTHRLPEQKKNPKAFWEFLEQSSKTVSATLGNSGAEEVPPPIITTASNGTLAVVDNSGVEEARTHITASAAPASSGISAFVDNVKLGEEGWKKRYYAEKFEADTPDEMEKFRTHAVLKYIEGICWVMHYYYQGVCSWQWFYPYHYAPFASDFHGLERLEIHFTLGEPFKPLNQLMAVLPAASSHALPMLYRKLMTDSTSPILDFYPEDFELDMNGKRFAWQAVCKLPFIKESRLLAEIAKVEHSLTEEEKRRNRVGSDGLFFHISHPLVNSVFSFCKNMKDHPKLSMAKVKRRINPGFSGGMNGYMYISAEPVQKPEICSPVEDMDIIKSNKVIAVFYKLPPHHPHIPRPPEGAVIPRKIVRRKDILLSGKLWHEKSSIFGCDSESSTVKSISGNLLGELSHRLISSYYERDVKELTLSCVTEPKVQVTKQGVKRERQQSGASIPCKKMSLIKTVPEKNIMEICEDPEDVRSMKFDGNVTTATVATPCEKSSKETAREKTKENSETVNRTGKRKRNGHAERLQKWKLNQKATADLNDSLSISKAGKRERSEKDGERLKKKTTPKLVGNVRVNNAGKGEQSEKDAEGLKKRKLKQKTTPELDGNVTTTTAAAATVIAPCQTGSKETACEKIKKNSKSVNKAGKRKHCDKDSKRLKKQKLEDNPKT
ncbi:hypothetical protein MKW92_041692 [Papaver armeniacum]|nr:hypothetical protein MKW92_041692 [Papaver armeniacum]